ncbi:hypothetical protein F0562_017350 [Nyssa sinensis]|uniref:Pentatricopeptide repeat-containing protein-mitochondrial domain-containing protein n=1 Tax=Nyssa sinensis TaxID=561372 RepID=A0A5J4ZGV4_9ASTE|nr:hypothetical protein F0562_017350 [Nyssa sinensis]
MGINSSVSSLSKETHLRDVEIKEENPACVQRVCENAIDNGEREKANTSILVDTELGNSGEIDVSPIVHKVTEIVRAENCAASMEERLEKVGLEFDAEIVEKVLKRCFKVPHLALRFFNWVKLVNGFCHTTEIYNTMLYIAVEAKEFVLVEELVEEMEKNSCGKDIKTWTILISNYGKANLIGKALLIFEKMRKSGFEPDEAAYKLMVRLLCIARKAEIAMEFYKEMVHKHMGLDMNLYKLLLNSLVVSGDIASVHLVADDMIQISQIPEHNVYPCMLKSFCIAGRIREALELIRDLKNRNVTLDPQNFETLVKGLCRADRITDALEIVDIMKKKTAVDEKVYGIIINGYLRRNDISKAFDLFQSIKESGHLPTTSTYTELMQHLFRMNEYQKASELYDEMLEKGVQLDSVAITAMVAGLVCQNRTSEAWEVFNTMEEKGIRVTPKSYSIFIKELCKISRMDEILKVLNKMQASKITNGDSIFNWVISHLEKKGETEMVEKVKQMQRAYKLYPQACEASRNDLSSRQELNMELNSNQIEPERVDSHLVESLSKSYNDKDLKEICGILSWSKDWCLIKEALEKCTIQFTPELVVEILRNCSLHGHSALHFFSWVGQQAGYSHSTETYNMAIKISGHAKDFKHMRSLFFEMRRRRCLITSDTWTIVIMQYGRTGLTEIALRNFREMKANDCKPTASTYKYLILSLCGRKGRKVDEAIEIFQEMIRVRCIPDKELVETYLACLCEVGKLLDARRCTESLRKIGFTIPLSYSLYIRALCRVGRLEEALASLDEVGPERSILDQYIYGSLVHGLLKRGCLEEALAKVEGMKQVGKSEEALKLISEMLDSGIAPSTVNFRTVFHGLNREGKQNLAHTVLQKKLALASRRKFST